MLEFLLADRNIAFAVVLVLLVAFFLIELSGLLFGASVSGLLGDLDLPEVDLDADLDLGVATKFLYWLKIGRVPLMVLLVIFMTAFVLCGYGLQLVCLWLSGRLLPGLVAAPVALALAVPLVRVCGSYIARIIPRDETEAVNRSELVGATAIIILGKASPGSPAQGRTTDRFGTTHYLMIEPDNPEDILEPGRELLLVRHEGARFYAIPHPSPGGE